MTIAISTTRLSGWQFSPLFALFFGLSIFLFAPAQAQASVPCGPPALVATGYFFTPYESISYTTDGYPILHMRIQSQYADGRPFTLVWSFQSDECESGDVYTYQERFSLPVGVSDWSIRFSSPTHFDVWDDQHESIILSRDIDTYPSYYNVAFFGHIDGGASTISTQVLYLLQGATPPIITGGLAKPEPCNAIKGDGYYFDGRYEHAEYVDGLLRIHLRLRTPYNDGRTFSSRLFTKDATCTADTSPSNPFTRTTYFTPYVRYFSFRMVTPTHFELWDDENNVKFECPDCSGDVPADAPFVGWHGSVDAGASYIVTTPFPPTETPACQTNCFSNVLFLPGIESSRLYKPNILGGDNRLWEPTGDSDAQNLLLDPEGKSIRNDIYTKDIIDEAYPELSLSTGASPNIYKSFIEDMNTMKDTDHFINDWEAIPYDWRLSLEDILNYGSKVNGRIYYSGDSAATSTPYIIQELKHLAATSRTGKVTIVAHSNGGLVAKALMLRLGVDASNYVDKIIFVAVPQSGTPQAIAGLLHGSNQGIPWDTFDPLLSPVMARTLGNNSPAVYNLLPSFAYFGSVSDPVVSFDPRTLPEWVSRYGTTIHTSENLSAFLADSQGKVQPQNLDVTSPASVNTALMAQTAGVHTALDSWEPPSGVQLIQIAGWGRETLSGITYKKVPTCTIKFLQFLCMRYEDRLTIEPRFVIDGDKTVMVPSALLADSFASRYWVDLPGYNGEHSVEATLFGRKHSDILEVPNVRELIKDSVTGQIESLQYISTTSPQSSSTKPRLHFILHSPLTLEFYDLNGKHVGHLPDSGSTEYGVSGVDFEKYGDVQWLSVPADLPGTVVMRGVSDGSFTLDTKVISGNIILSETTFAGIPSATSTIATIALSGTQLEADDFSLSVDGDGDGNEDALLVGESGAVVTIPRPAVTFRSDDKSILLGALMPSFTTTASGFVAGDSLPTSNIVGTPDCVSSAANTDVVGAYSITCTPGSLVSEVYDLVFAPGTLHISYRFDGFLQPINDTAHQIGQNLSVFKAGSTVPVKLRLKKADGAVVQASTAPQWIAPQKGAAMNAIIDEPVYVSSATAGSSFIWDSVSKQYIYNWNTKGLQAGYWYKLFAKLDDGTIYSVVVGLR